MTTTTNPTKDIGVIVRISVGLIGVTTPVAAAWRVAATVSRAVATPKKPPRLRPRRSALLVMQLFELQR